MFMEGHQPPLSPRRPSCLIIYSCWLNKLIIFLWRKMYNYDVKSDDVTKMGLTEFAISKSKLTFRRGVKRRKQFLWLTSANVTSQLSDSHNDIDIIAGFFQSTFILSEGALLVNGPCGVQTSRSPGFIRYIYERVEILLIEVYERQGKSVILARKKA